MSTFTGSIPVRTRNVIAREAVQEAFTSPVTAESLIPAVERGLVEVTRPRVGEILVRRGCRTKVFPDPMGVWEHLSAYFGWDE